MWGFFGALGQGTLGAVLGEKIAVAVANRNACEYCMAAHNALGLKTGASPEEMRDAQDDRSDDKRTAAALRFALQVVEQRGQVSGADVQTLHSAGLSSKQTVEILAHVAHVALNLFTNYVNLALAVPVDFPAVAMHRAE